MYIKNTRVSMHTPATLRRNHISTHVCGLCTQMRTRRCIPQRRAAGAPPYTLVAHTARREGTFTHAPGVACDRCWQGYCQEESAFISFYSLCILACLALYTVWPCHRGGFFSLPVPLSMRPPPPFLFLSPMLSSWN